MDNLNDLNNFLNEKRVTVKRRYTEAYPAKNVSTAARVRSTILDSIADGHITEEEMTRILSELKAHKRWLSRNKGLFNIGIAHGIRKNCDSIKANTLVGISYVWKIIGHATDAGFTLKETREFINNDTEKEVLRSRVKKYLVSLGLDPEKSNSLCNLGKEEIVNKSQTGKLLRMN